MKNLIKTTTRFVNQTVGKSVSFAKNYEFDEADKKLAIALVDVVVTGTLGKLGHRFDRKVVAPLIGRISPNVASKYLLLNKYAENVAIAIVFGKLGFAAYDFCIHKKANCVERARQEAQCFDKARRIN